MPSILQAGCPSCHPSNSEGKCPNLKFPENRPIKKNRMWHYLKTVSSSRCCKREYTTSAYSCKKFRKFFSELFTTETLSAFVHGCISADRHFRRALAAFVHSWIPLADDRSASSSARMWLWSRSSKLYRTEQYYLAIMRASRITVHYLRWRMPPFMRQCWGLPTGWPNAWGRRCGAS